MKNLLILLVLAGALVAGCSGGDAGTKAQEGDFAGEPGQKAAQ